MGYAFGSRTGFELGIEAFATYRFTGAGGSGTARSGAGPLAQSRYPSTPAPGALLLTDSIASAIAPSDVCISLVPITSPVAAVSTK
jgi:hypothetical protein